MKSTLNVSSLFCACLCFCVHATAQTIGYPASPPEPVSDTIFGKVIVDNYRWLEEVNSSKVQEWLKAQAHLTDQLLEKIEGRSKLIEEYKKLDEINTANIVYHIQRKGGRYFYSKTLRGENVSKLYYREGKNGKEVLLFDPQQYGKALSKEITFRYLPSHDGKKVAIGLTDSGKGDIYTVKFLNVDTKEFYGDSLYPVCFIQLWTHDNEGLIYTSLQTTDQLSPLFFVDMPVKLHRLGQDMKEDKTILSRHDTPELNVKPSDLLFINYSPDNKYFMIELPGNTRYENRSFFSAVSDLEKGKLHWKPLTTLQDQAKQTIIYKEKVYVLTRKGAPNFKLVVSPLQSFSMEQARTIVPESQKLIEWLSVSKDYLFSQKTDGIHTAIDQLNFSSEELQTIKLPLASFPYLQIFDTETNDCIIHAFSWKQPTTRYDYDPVTGKTKINNIYPPLQYPGTEDLVVEEAEVRSHDGTMVPLSLVYKKNIKKDGKNIVFMTGYGAYGIPWQPHFNVLFLPLLNRNIILAQTHPRGGGEKGHAWHMGGFKATKPNTWKDFIACAEFLVNEKYTSAKKLIGHGTSAGGILIGRAMTERPDLFAVAINNVPLSNPLRGENRPNGLLDSKEFGTVKDSTEAMGLIQMDAYMHILPDVKYPAVIAVAGINDTRVPVWQPAKLVAALQRANPSGKPILLQINYDSGHWSEEKFVEYRNHANMLSFALWQAGHEDFQPREANH